jgi:hypothetical protein
MATGARVSNAYPTCPSLRHSPSKDGLMRDAVRKMHINLTKGFMPVRDGDASD